MALLQQEDRFGEAAATLDFVCSLIHPYILHRARPFSVGVLQSQFFLARCPQAIHLSLSELQSLQLSNEHPSPSPGLVQARSWRLKAQKVQLFRCGQEVFFIPRVKLGGDLGGFRNW